MLNSRHEAIFRFSLQVTVAICALVPILAGLMGILLGPGMVDPTASVVVSADSHYRYLSGLLMGIGLGFLLLVPGIERHAIPFRLLTLVVVIGGFGRLYSLIQIGIPEGSMIFGLVMELVVTPLLAVWQGIVVSHTLRAGSA